MRILITGACGFIGYNVYKFLLKKKYKDIILVDNFSGQSSKKNFLNLEKNKIKNFLNFDLSNYSKTKNLIKKYKPDIILALHGQVAVTKSIENPSLDFKNNFLSVFNLLECVRNFSVKSTIINLSSNKVYGKNLNLKLKEEKTRYNSKILVDENFPLNFESPYSCSKGAADQYLIDYAKLYNLKTVSVRLSCVYGENQWGSQDQGWIAWFIKRALENKNINIFGNGKQVRDVLNVKDLAKLIVLLIKNKNKVKGNALNVGGGAQNTLSLLELIKIIEKKLNKNIKLSFLKERFGDQKYFVNNLSKVTKLTGWKPKVNINDGINSYIEWIKSNKI